MTELSITPENYSPLFNVNNGEYIDDYPKTSKSYLEKFPYGLVCCNGNKFDTRTKFVNHTKSQSHKMWTTSFKSKENDPIKKTIELEKTIKNQQIIIQHQSDELFFIKTKLNNDETNEIIYIIQERENVTHAENVFKIGITKRKFGERFSDYPSGSKPFFVHSVKNSKQIENEVKRVFNSKFELVRGLEYFQGDISDMIIEIYEIVKKF